jgi:hypothetical protein
MLPTKITQDHMSVSGVGFAWFCVSTAPAALLMSTLPFRSNIVIPMLNDDSIKIHIGRKQQSAQAQLPFSPHDKAPYSLHSAFSKALP